MMSRVALITGLMAFALAGPAGAETWDCGASAAYSAAFTLDTEVSSCTGWTAPSTDTLLDTIWVPSTIKRHPIGQTITLFPLPITRTFAERFYVEAPDRSSGIGAILALTADPGRLATVTGTLANVQGEIVLSSAAAQLGEMGGALDPLGMPSNALRLDAGLDPTGLFATVWGRVLSAPEGETYYTISDGGNQLCVLPEGVSRPGEGEYVVKTGVLGVAEINGTQVLVLRINAQ